MSKRLAARLAFVVILAALAAQVGPAPAAARPASEPIVFSTADGCTASLTCPNGEPLYCESGTPGTCTAGSNYVSCNGQTQYCPTVCSAQKECCDGSWVYCEGYSSCRTGWRGVACDGVLYSCPFCPPSS